MNKIEQSVYREMKAGLSVLSSSFVVPRVEGRQLSEIFFKLRLDCPEIFWAVSFQSRYYPQSPNMEVIPEYLFDRARIREHQKAMKARTEKLARPAKSMTDWEKERYIHDFICANVCYDKLKKPYSHEIIGPLGQGVGVCEGIAKAVKLLCDQLGLWCMIAVSEANPEKGIRYRHAWNILRIDGNLYHLDATFDNNLSAAGSELRYDYFNLDDSRLFRDHEPTLYQAPACGNGDHFYYREKKLSFTRLEEVARRAGQAAKKGRTFTFHWRGGHLTREVLKELLELLEEAARQRDRHAKVGLNWPQAVLSVSFSERTEGESLVLEHGEPGISG